MLIKTLAAITKMRVAGKLAAEVLEMIQPYVCVGISTAELEKICRKFIIEQQQAIPSSLHHYGFPAAICTSVNHVVCHGVPANNQILQDGDIINIDVTVKKDGYIGDTSKMFMVGKVQPEAVKLVKITQECLYKAIAIVRPNIYLGDIGYIIQQYAEANGYSIVREFSGHGIGQEMWEDPQVLHYGEPQTGLKLAPGMTFTIEPMLNQGQKDILVLADGWTVVTQDKKLSAQWEHTILVTEMGCEVLTARQEENFSNLLKKNHTGQMMQEI